MAARNRPESTEGLALAALRDLLRGEPEIARETSLLEVHELEGAQVPEPYRSLLVHERDMTGVLQRFSGQTLHVRPLHVERTEQALERRVLLVGDDDGRTIEFGAIRIHFPAFEAAAREEILGCRTPLGTILKRHGVQHRCEPRCYFRLSGAVFLHDAFELDVETALFGRVNRILGAGDELLAEVVEVLPPQGGRPGREQNIGS